MVLLFGKQFGSFLKYYTNLHYLMAQQLHSWVLITRNESLYHREAWT